MKRTLSICLLMALGTLAFCQTGKVTGSVMDAETKTPLELATVTIFALDSSIVAYKLSDKNGMFTIDKLPLNKKLLVSVTYTGYGGYNTSVLLNAGRTDTLTVLLALNSKDTVVVTATIPIRMNGDTLEINPAAFKMKKDAVVEELLNQVSGITIWSDGTITVNGKKVENLLVDGKPFMGSTDPRIATQNLPKSAIDKIQLYQEYDRSNIGQESKPQDSLLTMNVKLKENSKKGYFGKVGAGYGTMDRFESNLSFQLYNKRSSAGIGGGLNNINKNIGNIQEMFQNNTYRNFNPNLYNVGRFGTNGINKNHSIGGVFTHNFTETTNSRQNNRVSINYNKSGTVTYVTDRSLQNRTVIDNPQFILGEGVQNSRQNSHALGINYVKTNSYNDNLNVNGTANKTSENGSSSRSVEVRDTANRLQSINQSTTLQHQRSDNESLNLNFSRSNNDEPLKGFSLQANARRSNSTTERDVTSVFQSFTDTSQSISNNRRYFTNNQSFSIGGSLNYTGFKRLLLRRYNLFGINCNLGQRFNYSRSTDNNIVSDYDSTARQYVLNGGLSNENKKEILTYSPSLVLTKMLYKYTNAYSRSWNVQIRLLEDFKTDKNISSFTKRNLDRSFQFFRYEGNVDFYYNKREKYRYTGSINYTKDFEYPSIDRLYTIVDNINAYDIRIGNPNLKNSINHSLNMDAGFNTENSKSIYSINADFNGTYSMSMDPVVDSTINDFSGKRLSYYINADKTTDLTLGYRFNISRKINRNNIQLMYDGQFKNSKLPNYIDGVSNISETGSLTNQFNLQFSLSSILVFNAGYSLQHNKTRQTASGLRSFKNSSNTSKLGIVVNYPAGFSFSSTVDHIANTNIDKPTVLWNAFATYRFLNQQGEIKLSAMDLLKQYQNITNSVNAYGTTTRITNGLQQYFLLTFSYYPRKFGKREIKKATAVEAF